ncbi:MAG: ribonuclease E/G [Devosia sp.]|nr:ribonuclease E/G [Devosia sp.]
MATKRMLVDAIHPEETRIVVTSGNKLEEFDFESASRRQLRGNIYLAKVTRVEPSLQAAFIEYGGNRHGFLAFSEIHPDYYQIPVADREALLRDEEEHDREEAEAQQAEAVADAVEHAPDDAESDGDDASHIEQAPHDQEPVEQIGAGDALEDMQEQRRRPAPSRRNYKIQEVIKRRQVMLVQVVKEERGNKGAALTTYLSLAGRYSVLMPNTARGGGISRKITNAADRKRLKDIVGDLEVPPGQGIILRTAGASRTKAEVKRDFEYLQRLWENVRSLTLKSQAPCLVYEEGSLIKRTIRDLYNKDIDEVFVAGDDAYREAKDFMKMIMPSHAKNVQLYKEDQPIFSKYTVEGQLDQMFSPQVTLPSGGYLVINPTEALVSIDVNSGRSTREHNIEDTALQTNLEAADEVARQLRLRDLAGLIVIDFIDMMENRSNRAVERKLKDALKNDRARIQVGRISHFGLMEMSRQRIRFGVVESSTHVCPVCAGTGIVRSVESLALMVMRQIEDYVLRRPGQSINVKVPTDVALYILNAKRSTLSQLEAKYQLSITLIADDHLTGSHFTIEKGEPRPGAITEMPAHVRVDSAAMDDVVEEAEAEAEADEEEETEEVAAATPAAEGDSEGGRRRRRRRRGRDRTERPGEFREPRPPVAVAVAATADEDAELEGEELTEDAIEGGESHEFRANSDGEEPRRRRRRGRRGGRRNRREGGELPASDLDNDQPAMDAAALAPVEAVTAAPAEATADETVVSAPAAEEPAAEAVAEAPPKRPRRRRAAVVAETGGEAAEVAAPAIVAEAVPAEAAPKRTRSRKAKPAPVTEAEAEPVADPIAVGEPVPVAAEAPAVAATGDEPVDGPSRRRKKELPPEGIIVSSTATPTEGDDAKPKKAGWWQRGFFGG